MIQGHTAVLDSQNGVVSVGSQCHLEDAVRLALGLGQEQDAEWGLAHFHPAAALPAAGEEPCTEVTALVQVAVDLAEPTSGRVGVAAL